MGLAVKLKVSFRSCRRVEDSRSEKAIRAYSLARQIALAHFIEELIESGELASYAEAAARLGLTRARLSQVADLVLLAPEIQAAVLLRDLRVAGRVARAAGAQTDWTKQAEAVGTEPFSRRNQRGGSRSE